MIVKVAKVWESLGLNYSFAPEEDFLEKLTTIKQILMADH